MISFPNAKINLGLNVVRKRDDGFHDIETIFYPVQWCDVLELIPDEGAKSILQFKSSGTKIFSKEKQNLCMRSYQLLAEQFNLPPVKMYLHKIIPIGAGLGGGSSDGAFTLLMLNTIFNLKLTHAQLIEVASQIGSDCSFFIRNKPTFATGKEIGRAHV